MALCLQLHLYLASSAPCLHPHPSAPPGNTSLSQPRTNVPQLGSALGTWAGTTRMCLCALPFHLTAPLCQAIHMPGTRARSPRTLLVPGPRSPRAPTHAQL